MTLVKALIIVQQFLVNKYNNQLYNDKIKLQNEHGLLIKDNK